MQRDRDVLFGKVAIGRGALARPEAVSLYAQASSRNQSLWDLAVESGRLAPETARDILQLLEHGHLVCRGNCKARFKLSDLSPRATEACRSCGGPLFIEHGATPPPSSSDQFDAHAETKRDAEIGTEAASARADVAGLPTVHMSREQAAAPARPPSVATPAAPASEADTKDAPPEPGFETFTIAGYEVTAQIGRGGMGSVFRARQPALNRVVALKLLATEDKEQVKRFDREVKAIAKLNHPNIVKVFSAGQVKDRGPHEGKPYFAMDYIEGRDLLDWSREQPRSIAECALMVAKITDAMEYAHSRAIIHRDLKPQNILVQSKDDEPKICDFGLAQVRAEGQDLTRTGDVMGTPQYMPPEQALGDRKKIGPPTDTYALGAIFYELLCGRPPFVATRLHALIAMVVRDNPRPPSVVAPDRGIGPDVDAVVLKALAKNPVERFHTMAELGAALRKLAGR